MRRPQKARRSRRARPPRRKQPQSPRAATRSCAKPRPTRRRSAPRRSLSARAEVEQLRAAAEAEMRSARAAGPPQRIRPRRRTRGRHRRQAHRAPARFRPRRRLRRRPRRGAGLAPRSRAGTGSAGRARPRLTAPRELSSQEAQSCRDAFARALGRPLDFAVAIDPDLIAGLELETSARRRAQQPALRPQSHRRGTDPS